MAIPDPTLSWPTAQTVAYDGALNLARLNTWNEDQLFEFAKNFLISLDSLMGFYSAIINGRIPVPYPPPPYSPVGPQVPLSQRPDTWQNMRDYLIMISIMPDFLTYLSEFSKPVILP